MGGLCGKAIVAAMALVLTASSAQAWSAWYGGYTYTYYGPIYYYVPAYYYAPVYPVCTTVFPTKPSSQPAPKKAAETLPRATTNEPPVLQDMLKKKPVITESRSSGGDQTSAGNGSQRCKVGFWNLTGRDVTLKVDGQQRLLPKDRAITLDLDRSFAWQIDQGQVTTERVPDEQVFHEVILRQ
jgi:hypothetical protein